MGNAIKSVARFVAKAAVSAAGAAVPVIGGPRVMGLKVNQ